mmetsp:Transcript_10560/g.19346  ORF Transcript_10560/g.19346 Transcript_10560/m.19346 type:complete len:795 (-) Transcript_10560:63-2447(-)
MATSSGYHRPRRPASETITYLRGLPLDIRQAHEEVTEFLLKSNGRAAPVDDDDDDFDSFPQTLAAAFSALDEVKGEIASLAGDEYGSQSIELLTQIAVPYSEIAARILLHACSGYYLHLATHRYGSHVLQSILELSMSPLSQQDLASQEEAPPSLRDYAQDEGSLPSLYDLIMGVVDELAPHSSDLVVHLCGSHVLRTLLCVLGGVNLVASHHHHDNYHKGLLDTTGAAALLRGRPKSKKKKKKKHNSADESSSALHTSGTMTITYLQNSRIDPTQFSSTLESFTHTLLGQDSEEPGELQQLACHASAGPLLMVLIRVLTYSSDSARKEWLEVEKNTAAGDKTTNHVDNTTIAAIADSRLGIMRSEPRFEKGSLAHMVVKQILCWKEGHQKQQHAGDVIYGLSGEPRGSHILETILRLSFDEFYDELLECGDFLSPTSLQEYVAHDVSNFVVQTILTTVRSKEQAETILKIIEKVIASGLAIDPKKKRRGIVWRATELAAKYRVEQDAVLKAIRLGFLSVNASLDESIDHKVAEGETSNKKKKKQRKKASAVELKDCIPLLIDLRRDPVDDQKITIDAAGSRSVYHMLRFSPRLCQEVLQGIIQEMSVEDLVSIAKDGLGSRCIMDGILDGPVKTPNFAEAVKELRVKLSGHWTSLASDRVGHHSVKKLFKALPKIDDKAKLVEELVSGGNRLRGNAMGRSVMDACAVDQYRENRKDWRQKIVKTATNDKDFLAEAIPETSTEHTEVEEPKKAKRKRRRKKEDGSGEKPGKTPKTTAGITVDSIIDVLSTTTKS